MGYRERVEALRGRGADKLAKALAIAADADARIAELEAALPDPLILDSVILGLSAAGMEGSAVWRGMMDAAARIRAYRAAHGVLAAADATGATGAGAGTGGAG